VFVRFREYLPHYYAVSAILSTVISFRIINMDMDPSSKITWLVVIAIRPDFGSFLFWYIRRDLGFNALKYQVTQINRKTADIISQDTDTSRKLTAESPANSLLAKYISRSGCYPVYDHTDVTYFPSGEEKFRRMLTELERAEKFIFIEYFIIDEGHMWGKILDILSRKARRGVEIMVMYDGSNEFTTLPRGYNRQLEKLGIKCKVYAPATPFVSTHYNYRDHRKILVIDNRVAFTGGINLADEYINRIEKYGHWKDTAIMLKGPAVKSFTLMFLQMWNVSTPFAEYSRYLQQPSEEYDVSGYIIPYGDSPVDKFKVGRQVYLDIINRAEKYVHIMTPYLILDNELESALKFAAERGVDVKIMLPGIPDKKAPYALAKTHYSTLLDSGVEIYEYIPGFVHAKVFVSDAEKAVVGTINLDYRSLYHHFECAAYMYKTGCISDIEQDFLDTLKRCRQVTKETVKREKLYIKITGKLLKIVAPLM